MSHHAEDIKEAVRDRYAGHAREASSCCPSACCSPAGQRAEGDLGLGCGDPLALESLAEGETVVDLGSGGGVDCFTAARRVGPGGRVIGVDMTPEMIALAQRNARLGGYGNVEFRLGEAEHLPVEDGVADLVISNCVINLVPDKARTFAETFRVLKPGGRLSVSDIVTTGPLPAEVAASVSAYVGCLAGASMREDYLAAIRSAGFTDIEVVSEHAYATEGGEAEEVARAFSLDLDAEEVAVAAKLFRSATVHARKPA